MMEEYGCSYQVKHGILKIMEGAIMMMKSHNENGTYVLDGSIIIRNTETVLSNQKTEVYDIKGGDT